MSKHYYAGCNSYGTNFTYDSAGWDVHVFESKKERDNWVSEDSYSCGNPTREVIDRNIARNIVGQRVKLVWNESGDMGWFEEDNSYYNPRYWG